MEITSVLEDNKNFVTASGRVDSFTAPRLNEMFQSLIEKGQYQLVFDMTAIDYMSSAGLRVLIDVQKMCKQQEQGELVLVGVQKRIHETLELAGFLPLFRFFNDLHSAKVELSN